MLVLGYIWLPFVALPIFVSLESLDRRLLEAASDLGASRLRAFRRITLPLSLPGVVAAFFFVFIPTLGEFVTPSLVGGASGYMYGNQIVDLFGTGFPDWETGSVLALFLLVVVARADGRLLAVPAAAAGGDRTDGRRALEERRARCCACSSRSSSSFLYAPIVILLDLLVQQLGRADVPAQRASRSTGTASSSRTPTSAARSETSAIDRRTVEHRRRGARRSSRRSRSPAGGSAARPLVSALLLSPLVIPYVVFGISLLLLFHTLGVPRSC